MTRHTLRFRVASLVSLSSYSTEFSFILVAFVPLLYRFFVKLFRTALYRGIVSVHSSLKSLDPDPVHFPGNNARMPLYNVSS